LLQIYMTFPHNDDISGLCSLVPSLQNEEIPESAAYEKEAVSQASQDSSAGRRGRLSCVYSNHPRRCRWVALPFKLMLCVSSCSMCADVAMINSSSALGESVPLQRQFPGFYAGTSQADSENGDASPEKGKVITLWYASALLHGSKEKSTCLHAL